MAKKIRKPVPVKTKNFIITSLSDNAFETFGKAWEIRYRGNKNAPGRDTVSVLATLTYSEGDIYHCSELSIESFPGLTADEWKEILETMNTTVAAFETVEFVSLNKSAAPSAVLECAAALKLADDPRDSDYLLWEQPVTQWGPIYMLLGMSVGTSFGVSMGNNSMGMCIGMAIGLAIGSGLTSNAKKAREALKTARIDGTEPPKNK